MILSPGRTLPRLRREAQGTVLGNGVGMVVLKRLDDALADGDAIHAVVHRLRDQQRRLAEGRVYRAERGGPAPR